MVLVTQAVKYLEPQIRLAAKAGKHKKEYKLSMISDRTLEKVSNLAAAPIEAVFTDPSYGKVRSVFLGAADFNQRILLGSVTVRFYLLTCVLYVCTHHLCVHVHLHVMTWVISV